MSIRTRLVGLLAKGELEGMQRTLDVLSEAWQRGPYSMPQAQVVQALREADSWMVDYILRQRGWQLLTTTMFEFGEADRLRAVDEARFMYNTDVQTAKAVNGWTDFGFGQSVMVEPADPALALIWQEFWSARRNVSVLGDTQAYKLSNRLIVDGELFLVVFGSRTTGQATVRRIDTKEISEIIYEPDDPDVPLYYVKRVEGGEDIYYPDWRATPAQLKTVEIPKGAVLADDLSRKVTVGGKPMAVTSVRVIHVVYDDIEGRGWPMMRRVYEWSRVLRNFLGDRAAVARAVAAYVDEVIHAGGSRATDAIASRFASSLSSSAWGTDTNPPPPAGSTLIHNKAVEVSRRPLTTGAMDAEADGQMLAGQVSAGTGMPLHWMGWPQALANRATAREMARPWNAQLGRYQGMWVTVFQALVEIVAMVATEATGQVFEDVGATVTLQSPVDVQLDEIGQAMEALTSAASAGIVDGELAVEAAQKLVEQLLLVLGIVLEQEEQEPEEPPEGEEIEIASLQAVMSLALERMGEGLISAEDFSRWLSDEVARL